MIEKSNIELATKTTSHRCALYRFDHSTELGTDGETVHVYNTVTVFSGHPDKVPHNFGNLAECVPNVKMIAALAKNHIPPIVTGKITPADLIKAALSQGVSPTDLVSIFRPDDLPDAVAVAVVVKR